MNKGWGAQILPGGRAAFRIWAPDRGVVTLEIEGAPAVPMTLRADGWFEAEAPAVPGIRYRFDMGDALHVADPAARAQSGGVHGWSVLVDPDAYRWQMTEWHGRPWEETVIEEVHAGILGGFRAMAERLPAMAELGITAVEIMPIAAFGGSRNWGYDGVLPYAVAESYGTPHDFKAFVDRAHECGLMVFLDVVYNHFGPDGNYLGAYASGFFDAHTDTPWGGAVAVSRDPVRRFFINNALMWLGEYRLDGLRFDAVHAIGDNGFLDAMANEIRGAFSDRHVHLILENEHNDPDRLAPDLYDAQWNDDFHNVLHVLLTGEREAYYRSFAEEPTAKLARCLSDGFIYQGETPTGANHARGRSSGHLPATRFVSFLQNHDQIGNRAMGERLSVLVDQDRLRTATALLLLAPQIPLLFMGDSDGSRSPFLFFTDFHEELADAVREGRRAEFAGFSGFADAEARARIPDPNAPATFAASFPEPGPDATEWRAFYRALLALRHAHIVPRLAGARGEGAQVLGTGAVAAAWRMGDDTMLTIALNLSERRVTFPPKQGDSLFTLGAGGDSASFRAELMR
jgi:maltooligosyltrehalose trehalohydrolase